MNYSDTNLRKAALYYASIGLAVFPLKPRDKAPIYNHGFKIATTDIDKINMWWSATPDANIGIACGEASGGLVAIDCDKHEEDGEDGYIDLLKYAKEHKSIIPDTLTVTTGGGGTHFLFRSKKKYRNRTRVYGAIDVRADGGYIVAPPSIHPSGERYEFDGGEPEEVEIAEINEMLDSLINEKPDDIESPEGFKLPEIIEKHSRNDTLFRYSCKLRQSGLEEEEILDIVQRRNDELCTEPLTHDEVQRIVESASKYEKGAIIIPSGHGLLTAHTIERTPQIQTTDKGIVIQSIKNAEEAIEFDEFLSGRIKFNDLVSSIFVTDYLPWDVSSLQEREWNNNDDNNLLSYLEKYGLRHKENIMSALSNVAHRHHYHPVKVLLEELEQEYPNAKGYIENLMPDYLGAQKTKLNTSILRVWMLGAISRVFSPGTKFDTALVIVGDQGAGKSTFISQMALNPRFYNDNLNTIEGDKAFEKLKGIWIAEMAELLAQKGAKDVEAIKAFITSQNDRYREPYSRRSESHPRQCVFAGTTNEDFFLVDTTGNRRFLPVRAYKNRIKKDIWSEDAAEDFKRAWAEAMHIYRSGKYKLVIPKEYEEELNAQRSEFQEENVKKGIIENWIDRFVKPGDLICVAQVRECALNEVGAKFDMKTSKEIASILNSIPDIAYVGQHRVASYGNNKAWRKIDFNRFDNID